MASETEEDLHRNYLSVCLVTDMVASVPVREQEHETQFVSSLEPDRQQQQQSLSLVAIVLAVSVVGEGRDLSKMQNLVVLRSDEGRADLVVPAERKAMLGLALGFEIDRSLNGREDSSLQMI